jgi:hypothetical protein
LGVGNGKEAVGWGRKWKRSSELGKEMEKKQSVGVGNGR